MYCDRKVVSYKKYPGMNNPCQILTWSHEDVLTELIPVWWMKMQNKLNSRFEQNLACIIQPLGILAKRRASQINSQSAEEALPFLMISASLMIFNIWNIIFPSAEEEDHLITYCFQKYLKTMSILGKKRIHIWKFPFENQHYIKEPWNKLLVWVSCQYSFVLLTD